MSQSRTEQIKRDIVIIQDMLMQRQASITELDICWFQDTTISLLKSLPEDSEKYKDLNKEYIKKVTLHSLYIKQQIELQKEASANLKFAWDLIITSPITSEKIISDTYRKIHLTKTSGEIQIIIKNNLEELKAIASSSPTKPKQAADSKATQQDTDKTVLKELAQLKDQVAKLTDAVTMLSKQLAEKNAADKTPTMLSSAYNPKMGFAKQTSNG